MEKTKRWMGLWMDGEIYQDDQDELIEK